MEYYLLVCVRKIKHMKRRMGNIKLQNYVMSEEVLKLLEAYPVVLE